MQHSDLCAGMIANADGLFGVALWALWAGFLCGAFVTACIFAAGRKARLSFQPQDNSDDPA